MRRALIDTLNIEGLALHPEDRAVLDAWARHELDLPQAIDRLHALLDEAASTLTPEERRTRALAAFPTLRLAELQCYGLDQLPPPATPPRLAVPFPPLTLEERKVYTEEEIPKDYDGYLIAIPIDYTQAQIESSSDPKLHTEGEPVTPSSTLTLEQQLADIGAELLASAQRLATDEKHRLEIQKLLF